ncbi:MAG TPA: cupin domain-containing protein [Pyrinomonadaceae bacterium]
MNHHVNEEVEDRALLYALGALTQHEARAYREHLDDGCAVCCEELREFEDVAGLLGIGAPEAAPPARVREKIVESLGTQTRGDAQSSSLQEAAPPQSLTIRAGEGMWHETLQGVFVKKLFADKKRGTVTTLVRMAPGARLPRHRHYGVEECLVLEGDVQAGEQMLGAGDYHCAMAESIHERLSTINGALFLIVGPRSYEALEQL